MSLRLLLLIFIFATSAALGGLMAWGITNQDSVTTLSGFTRVGKLAPSFALPLLGGDMFDLEDHHGKVLVINFWASWCPSCREETLHLERTWERYKHMDVMMIGVNIQDTEKQAISYIEEFQITHHNVKDESGSVTLDYGVIGIPVTFLVDRNGFIARRWVGAIQEQQLSTWIEELLTGVDSNSDAEKENLEHFSQL